MFFVSAQTGRRSPSVSVDIADETTSGDDIRQIRSDGFSGSHAGGVRHQEPETDFDSSRSSARVGEFSGRKRIRSPLVVASVAGFGLERSGDGSESAAKPDDDPNADDFRRRRVRSQPVGAVTDVDDEASQHR